MNARFRSLLIPRDWWGFTVYQAIDSLKRQFNRTKLGPFWIVLSQFVFISGLALVFSSVLKQPLVDFLPFISAGLITWTLIASAITSAPLVYLQGSSVIQSFRVPFAIFPMQSIVNGLILFAHGCAIHLLVMLALGKSIALMPLALVMVLLLVVILYPFVAVLGILGARFRDFAPAINSAMYMAFLMSPVIWQRQILAEDMRWIADLNPFAHMIEIVRQPMLGQWPPTLSLIICVVMAVVSVAVGETIFRRLSRPLPFWV
jgi:lipopolysaccharide transport system permease protein